MAETIEILGKYEVKRTLGKGAMGTVYEGWDPIIARRVAIKTVRIPDTHDDPETEEALARFRREAQAAGRLTHPNIVGVFDYGETGDIAYIVMEYVDGPSVKSLVDKHERFGLPETLRIMTDLLNGLQFSHARGVVHRDIKPANIMLTSEGQGKIADFGIARIESSSMTQAGTVLGTPAYMSPEQFMGQVVDARTDIYSSGVVLYQLLTGERPFEGGMSAIMHKALNTDPPLPSQMSVTCPTAFDGIVRKAMAKRPEERFQSAAAFLEAVQAAAAGKPLPGMPVAEVDEAEATMVAPSARRAAAPAAPALGAAPAARAASAGPAGRAAAAASVSAAAPAAGKRSSMPMIAAAVVVLLVLAGGGAWFFLLRGRAPAPVSAAAQNAAPVSPTAQNAGPTAPAAGPSTVAKNEPTPTAPPASTAPAPGSSAGSTAGSTAPAPGSTEPAPGSTTGVGNGQPPAAAGQAAPTGQAASTAQVPPAAQQAATTPAPTTPAPTTLAPTAPAASTGSAPATAPVQLASAGLDTLRQQISALTLKQPCVLIDGAVRPNGDVTLTGLAGKAQAETFRQALGGINIPGEVQWRVNGVDPTFCAAIDALQPIDPIFGTTGSHLGLSLARGQTELHDGAHILPRLVMPDFRGRLIVDYVGHDGTILHLYPQIADRSQQMTADPLRMFQPGEAVDLGEARPGHPAWEVGPPYGTDMIIAIASSQPLFDRPRPNNVEQAATYLPALRQAVDAAQRRGAKLAGDALTVDTLPK